MKRYKKLLVALAAVASIYLVKATGIDGGLIDNVLDALVETVVNEEAAPAPEVTPQVAPEVPSAVLEEKSDAEKLDQKER
jgi:hypothetical protein